MDGRIDLELSSQHRTKFLNKPDADDVPVIA
jgi:hypothetical protein